MIHYYCLNMLKIFKKKQSSVLKDLPLFGIALVDRFLNSKAIISKSKGRTDYRISRYYSRPKKVPVNWRFFHCISQTLSNVRDVHWTDNENQHKIDILFSTNFFVIEGSLRKKKLELLTTRFFKTIVIIIKFVKTGHEHIHALGNLIIFYFWYAIRTRLKNLIVLIGTDIALSNPTSN